MAGRISGKKPHDQIDSDRSFFRILDAIANGVEAKYEYEQTNWLLKMTVEETATIARKLDIPENEIQRWLSSKHHNQNDLKVRLSFLKESISQKAKADKSTKLS